MGKDYFATYSYALSVLSYLPTAVMLPQSNLFPVDITFMLPDVWLCPHYCRSFNIPVCFNFQIRCVVYGFILLASGEIRGK